MNIDDANKLLIKAFEQRDYKAIEFLQKGLATEFGSLRGWKICKPPPGIGQLIRRGKYPGRSDLLENLNDLDHNTWYKNTSGEMVGLVTQPYAPLTCDDPRLKITQPDFPKWHAPDNPNIHFYLIEPTATESLTIKDVAAYRKVKSLMGQGKTCDEIDSKLVRSAYKVAKQWLDEIVSNFLTPVMISWSLFNDQDSK